MISKEALKEYARTKGYNLGQAEKDYFQEIILFVLYQEFGKELVFKGGTALTKCYGFNRFSEDLDFNCSEEKNFREVISAGLKRYYLDFEIDSKKSKESIRIIVRIKGPLYMGQKNSACRVILDINLREKLNLEPNIKRIGIHIEEIPLFDVVVMSEKEILAEKVRALMTRNKARDLYDLYYLLEKGVKIDKKLIDKKLEYYSLIFTKKKFLEAVNLHERIWQGELKHLVNTYPDFKIVKKKVIESIL